MSIAITKSIPASSVQNSQAGRYSPNLNISYWVAGAAQVPNLGANATLMLQGYFDQAGKETAGCQSMGRMTVTVPAADVSTALASDSALGTWLLANVAAFAGGSAAEAS